MHRIIIDILHTPHINFFKNIITILEKKGYKVDIICLDRGKNFKIIKEEFPNNEIFKIGKHRGGMWSIIFSANIFRFFFLLKFLYGRGYNIGVSVSGFLLGAALKIYHIPNIQFYDDPENRKNLNLQLLTADGLFYPPFKNLDSKIQCFKSLKEWSYLSPEYFVPDNNVLKKYGLESKRYIFVRDVSVNTSNYKGQKNSIISSAVSSFPKEYDVILSIEDKTMIHNFPSSWKKIQEPEKDIHSLIYYSRLLVSSGDSMAREGAILGVPSIYCGIREMTANKILIEKGMLFHSRSNLHESVNKVIEDELEYNQSEYQQSLLDDWGDLNEYIIDKIDKYKIDK